MKVSFNTVFWFSTILRLFAHLSPCVAEDYEEYAAEAEDEVELTNTTYAYIYYTDATCLNDGEIIRGTFNLGYDNYNLTNVTDAGFSMNDFYGSCWYFEGGRYDVMEYDGGTFRDSMKRGRCVAACDGSNLIGCSDTDECVDFSSVVTNEMYTDEMFTNNYPFVTSSSEVLEKAVMYELHSNSGVSSATLGALVGCAFIGTLLAGLEGRRRYLNRNSINDDSLTENLPVTSAVV